ncbi:MAG: hypothetical protein U1F61_17115 [Opitutaceae bacterium]
MYAPRGFSVERLQLFQRFLGFVETSNDHYAFTGDLIAMARDDVV